MVRARLAAPVQMAGSKAGAASRARTRYVHYFTFFLIGKKKWVDLWGLIA